MIIAMSNKPQTERKLVRIAGKLKEIVTVKDVAGRVLQKIVHPVMVEFYPRDLIQVIVGATILAIPVAFTEETWNLGEKLPIGNVLLLALLSLLFISIFVYYNYYRAQNIREYLDEFIKRAALTYVASFVVVGVILTIILQAPWAADWMLALKRTIIVAFPASMSAAVADILK